MPHFMLSWQDAVIAAGVLGLFSVLGFLLSWRFSVRWRVAAGVAREAGLLFGLYGLWQFAGKFTAMSAAGGLARGRWIWHFERAVYLPSETVVQRPFLHVPWLVQTFNLYYDIVHFPALIACLIWVYAWHRSFYPRVRTIVVLFTAASLAIQLIPVAPPRLLAFTGMTDTAFHYGQSVYTWGNGALEADQYSAMPSVHVGWALIVALAVLLVYRRSRWRWTALIYPVLTTLVVVVTANHFWLDGIVAAVLVLVAWALSRLRWRRSSDADPAPSLERVTAGALCSRFVGDLEMISFRPTPDQYAWTFGGAAPVKRLRPPVMLEVFTEDCFAGRVTSADDLVSQVCEFPFLNPQTGPFWIEGASPGDTLAVHFVSITPARSWAASTTVPLFGALTSTHLTATLQEPLPEVVWMWELDAASGLCRFSPRSLPGVTVDLPMEPMHGTVGVAPANLEVRSALVPDAFGGNMDTPEMRAGVTCYLGVNVSGALFSLGDGHARQGEGETCGVAVECAMNTVLVVDLLRGVPCPWPRLESDDFLMSAGSARPLEDAFRIASVDMVQWVSSVTGMSTLDAYQLVTQGSQAPLANVCDTNYTSVVKMPKRFLPAGSVAMSGTHDRLRSLAASAH